MKVELYKPQNEKLQKYIECFYTLTHSKREEKVSYLTFPSTFSIVAIVHNAENTITSEKVITKFCLDKSLETSLVCRFNKPICFQYEGEIKEVCIYFKPLGLNAFLKNPLETYSKGNFDSFNPFIGYQSSMETILSLKDNNDLISNLEKYWLEKLIGFEHYFLSDAVNNLIENPNQTTSSLAEKYNISQRTLIKHFKRHLCKTPSEFKKIVRFRKALSEKKKSNEITKLTELSYISNFFDQSHMINDFKSLTGLTPKSFFKNLSALEKNNINWIFV